MPQASYIRVLVESWLTYQKENPDRLTVQFRLGSPKKKSESAQFWAFPGRTDSGQWILLRSWEVDSLSWVGFHCRSNFSFCVSFGVNHIAWSIDLKASMLSVPDGFSWAEPQHFFLLWKWPGYFANNHPLQSIFTVCFRSSEGQANFAKMPQARAPEQPSLLQHREIGNIP